MQPWSRQLESEMKPHPKKRAANGRMVSDLPVDEEGRSIIEAHEAEQCGLPIYGHFCAGCPMILWTSFPEDHPDYGLLNHSCGAQMRFVKPKE